ncbi:MCE family protein [Actinomadura algeriensis]|uniref:Phospholipid/cholesterol/gamma-HCH transport system substrate-binding protein n=1 Tax=Actinomadura algeriensis TaxID=1679523 RepID=A0ABR9K1G2_9ACTN|nr:MCE family protein [Actinomadura algeriensis]MBE1536680.1 phospholipid/cholesterol/gamma-HCH transport system substrate-binding protein [Actinomadura algeriensis]
MRFLLFAGVLVLTGSLSGCSLQTLTATAGPLTLTAEFTDVQNLVSGHSVKIADVEVGSVSGVALVGGGTAGYRARVTMSIKDGVEIPTGTAAKVTVTSLLGENYVQLEPPQGRPLNQGPFLKNNARVASAGTSPGFEDIVGGAAPLVGALAAGDAPGLVHTAATALSGRGPKMNAMIGDAATLVATFEKHRGELARAVDDLAGLGEKLAAHEESLGRLPGRLAETTQVLADDREKILTAVRSLSDMAKTVNDTVLIGYTDELRGIVERLGPSMRVLADDRTKLGTLITRLQEFVDRMPRQVYNGQLLTYAVINFDGSATRAGAESPSTLADLVDMLGPGR